MSVGVVNKQTGDRIPTAGMPAIDAALSGSSTNPVQNRVVKAAFDAIKDGQSIDSFADVETALGEKADIDIVASDFSTAVSYTEGDYCIYEGKFYKFKANHSGAWSAADVDEIKIAGELTALKSGLTNLVKVYHANGTTDSVGDFIFNVPGNGTLLYVRPLRDAEYYNSWWGVILASAGNNVGYSAKAIKDDGTALASQSVKYDVYYI